MVKDIISGISKYFKAFGLIFRLQLWSYFAIPILISLITGILMVTLPYFFSTALGALIAKAWRWEWGAQTVGVISNFIAGLLLIALGLIVYKHIVMALSAPFMSPVSEKIEAHILGNSNHNPRNTSFREQLMRGIRINVRNLSRELLFTIPLLVLSFIPIAGLFATALIFVIQAYYAGFGNMDYTMERHLNYKDSIQFVKQNRGIAIGNGILFILLLFIPILGFIITLPIAVTAASVETVKRLSNSKNNKNEPFQDTDQPSPILR